MWRLLGASTCGTSHRRNSVPCQDSHKFLTLPNDAFVAAAGDGAGSAKYADRGSSMAVDCAVSHVAAALSAADSLDERACRSLLQSAIEDVRLRLASACHEGNDSDPAIQMRDLATTLLICFSTGSLVAACQIGDGAIVELAAGGEVQTLTRPIRSEYLNETTFVTSDSCGASATYMVKDATKTAGVVLLTDGIQSLAMQLIDDSPFSPFFQNVHQYACGPTATSDALAAFLDSPRVCERTDDDKTLVIAVRQPTD